MLIQRGKGEKALRKSGLIMIVAVVVMLIPSFTPVVHSPEQPPIDANTLHVGTIGWGPRRADTVRAYDVTSMELIRNVYDTLISTDGEVHWQFVPNLATNVPTVATTTLTVDGTISNRADPKGATLTGPGGPYKVAGWCDFNETDTPLPNLNAGDVIYMREPSGKVLAWYIKSVVGASTLNLERYSYLFHVHTSSVINFVNETGQVVDQFDEDDIKYSFHRGMVQGQSGSPMWMFYEAFFGVPARVISFGPLNGDNWDPTGTAPCGSAMDLAHLIDTAVEVDTVAHTAKLNLGIPFPDNAFKNILSNTMASIVSKEFSISIGCWDGNLYADSNGDGCPDWWTSVRKVSRSPYDTIGKYRYVGTGPYRVTTFNQTGNVVVMQKNPDYWRGWPATGCNGSLDTIEIDYISDWTTRKNKFLAGTIDICAVPGAYMFELIDPVTKEPPAGVNYKTIKNFVPEITMDAMHFVFTIDPTSPYIYTGTFPDGIYPDFFNNTHVRKAFAYSFNITQYTEQVCFGEANYRKNWMVNGLYPDYYDPNTPGYNINYAAAEAELKQAVVDGQNVWSSGFKIGMAFPTGYDQRRIACEMIRDFFGNLSTFDGRMGPPFQVVITEIDYDTYLGQWEEKILPIFDLTWFVDFRDADDFVRPYMHSWADFSYLQSYTTDNGWGATKDALIDLALVTPDGANRQALYEQLALIYYNDCPSFPLPVPLGRFWCQYWVKGWYNNGRAIVSDTTMQSYTRYPGTYFYTIWKQDNCWYDVTGPTQGVSDGIVNMRDISYLITHFLAKAPATGETLDPKWVGVYGANGCVDPSGDRVCNMRDIARCIVHFNHRKDTGVP